jgi:hypothetical protein
MSSFTKNVTFTPNTIFIEPSGNVVVPRMNPPWPTEFKSTLWYSQRELAYMERAEYREMYAAMRASSAAAKNPVMPAVRNGGGGGGGVGVGGGPHTLVFK